MASLKSAIAGLALLCVGEAPGVDAPRELRIQPDGIAVVGDGPVQAALVRVCGAPAVVSPGVFRVQPDGIAVVGDGLFELAFGGVALPRLA